MFGRPVERNGFGKYSTNSTRFGSQSGLGHNSNEVNNLGFGAQTSGSVFGGSAGGMNGEAKQVAGLKNGDSMTNYVFGVASPGSYNSRSSSSMLGTGGFVNGGSSNYVVGGNQPFRFMPVQGSAAFTFGRTASDIDALQHSAFRSSSSSFGGSSGGTLTFGSKLNPFGITTTSNGPAFGNTGNAVAPASGPAFHGASRPLSSYVSGNSTSRSGLGFSSGDNIPSGVGKKTKPYHPTTVVDDAGKRTASKLQTISAMPDYQIKSHEELRWEDYQCNRGCSWDNTAVQPNKKIGSDASLPTGIDMPHITQPFPSPPVENEKPAFTTINFHKPKGYGTVTSPCLTFPPPPSATLPEASFKSRANLPHCCSASRSTVLWASPQPALVSMPSTHIPVASPPFGQSSLSFSCFLECPKPQETEVVLGKDPLQTSQGLALSNGLLDGTNIQSQPDGNKISSTSSIGDVKPAIVANPFGNYREIKPISLVHSESASMIQRGISSMPVVDKPTPVKLPSSLTCRHLSRSRITLSARKPPPTSDGPKVPFFYSPDDITHATKGHSSIIARENTKSWMTNPTQLRFHTKNADTVSPVKSDATTKISSDNFYERDAKDDKTVTTDLIMPNKQSKTVISQTSEEHGTLQLPKLQLADYYTEPSIEELAAKEKAEPGFISHVKDFVVGRHGYGHIKFFGETDVRQLDINSILVFNHREVIVHMDESTKPPMGQGLNKPAEITLLNIKFINKKTGCEYTDGEDADKVKELLIQKASNNGAKFISYKPVAGEWKFSVPHFGC